MKISRGRLRQLINEETERVMSENFLQDIFGSNSRKADLVLDDISNKVMRGAGGEPMKVYVAKWLKKIADADVDDLSMWDGAAWPSEDDPDYDRLFTTTGDEVELGGQLHPKAVALIDAALTKRGV